ncbi:MAG: DUF3445 domain-containing protein [Ketobacter sp.]|nr:MAG: DUF3445 domain-containing protein [Ketobacter sp.]
MSIRNPDPFAFLSGDSLLRMGLTPISDQEWVAPFSRAEYETFSQHKRSVLERNPKALLVDGAADVALAEFYVALKQHLQRDHPGAVLSCSLDFHDPEAATPAALLRKITLWVPDDICILQAEDGGEYQLTAVSVLSPSAWNPVAKFRRSLSDIHQPIPKFKQRLMPSVDRFFHHIKSGRPVVRYNWGIQQGDRLDRMPGTEVVSEDCLYYRSERQTLLRLPGSQAVVFLIRTQLWELAKLDEMSGEENTLQRLLNHISGLSQEERDYKGLTGKRLTGLQCALERLRN